MSPSLAVWKFASCDGCQLTLLDCEDELLTLAEQVQIATFAEASSCDGRWPLRSVARRRIGHHPVRRAAHPRNPGTVKDSGGHRGVCHRRWHPGAAQLRRRRRVHLGGLRPARLHPHAGHLDSGVGARHRRLRAAQAARSTGGSCSTRWPPCWSGRKPRLPAATVCTECKTLRRRRASPSPRASPASVRSPMPGAARCARATTAAATDVSARWPPPICRP